MAQVNASAVKSLDEGLEETLTLHRLGLFQEFGGSFRTTDCIEKLDAIIAQRTDDVDCWPYAEQRHRWLARSLFNIEPGLGKVSGHRPRSRQPAIQEHDRKKHLPQRPPAPHNTLAWRIGGGRMPAAGAGYSAESASWSQNA